MNHFLLALGIPMLIAAAFTVSACQSSGADMQMVGELPFDGKLLIGQ